MTSLALLAYSESVFFHIASNLFSYSLNDKIKFFTFIEVMPLYRKYKDIYARRHIKYNVHTNLLISLKLSIIFMLSFIFSSLFTASIILFNSLYEGILMSA